MPAHIFNALIESFIKDKVGIAENFLSLALAAHLKANLLRLLADNQLYPAGTGNKTPEMNITRGDSICWLDRNHHNIHEDAFFDLMDEFVQYLNDTCYTGITGYEFHYAVYEKGTFYKKHLDRFRNNDSRKYSMIMYLNTDWQQANGGELCIHHADHLQHVSPTSGKTVFFNSSELMHEVLETTTQRISITGWLKG